MSAAATDDDGDTVTFTYQWTNDGADIVGQTGSSLDLSLPGNGGKNHVMAVKVTAHDGNGGTSTEVTALGVTIANTPPSATVSLNTATPGTNQTLTATATKSDADGEAITLTYEWKVNGATKQTTTKTGLTDTFDLSASGNGSEGDAITVTVTPDDSDALGTPVSASATVGNTAPVVNSIAIDQASALTNDTLTTSVVDQRSRRRLRRGHLPVAEERQPDRGPDGFVLGPVAREQRHARRRHPGARHGRRRSDDELSSCRRP